MNAVGERSQKMLMCSSNWYLLTIKYLHTY